MRSKFHPTQIAQLSFDEDSEAVKVKITDTQMQFHLDHKSDSITMHPAKLTASAIGCEASDNGKEIIPPLDCSSLKTINVSVEGTGMVDVEVSPNDSGDFFYTVNAKIVNSTIAICARRIRIKSVDAIGNVHLVGQG